MVSPRNRHNEARCADRAPQQENRPLNVPVLWQDQAIADLDRILDYIERESPQGALTMARAIREGADVLLSEYSKIGRRGRVAGTRELVITRTPFVLVYRLRRSPQRVEILRLLHGAQKWPSEKKRR
ncbi:type II toxin-antitoxin system RelE/ParE family toxin [Methylosinus sporium]|uniref:Type II toxin-antitoxin system RelE/ParE family toxin n=1 Tax=Methylosinus sporium TaxID=428 RepID=A0A549SSY7_METSR|nr:type II toxin-antitoxin system RelE/ParE family toxin [Methylosinus sporium]